jgi:hypothetical protein
MFTDEQVLQFAEDFASGDPVQQQNALDAIMTSQES